MIKQNLRSNIFWFLDMLKGGVLKTHFDEITDINQNNEVNATRKKRASLIRNLLNHATETTPYYKGIQEFENIEDFPVISKTVIQDNFKDFRAENYLDKPIHKVATSGSTGVPFFLYQDANKKLRNTADTLYFFQKANFNLGERLYDLEVWRDINMKSPIISKMQNLIYIDISRFNDEDIKSFLEKIQGDSSPKNLIGFVSAFENICLYLDKIESKPLEGLEINSIVAISEFLTSYVKISMEKYFGVSVVSRYSNEELGIIAQQFPIKGKEEFNINWASYHVEILKMESDIPADAGENGRIVITDLFNYCMPIIRYDTGDISVFETLPTKKSPYPVLKRIEGRRMDIVYDTKGEIISSHIIYTKFYSYYHLLKQYQFIQIAEKEYHVKLNTHSKDFNYEQNLIQDIQKDFGIDAIVKIILVDEIPALSSGKRKKVVNLFSQKA